MKKRIVLSLLTLCLLFSVLTPAVLAEEETPVRAPDSCGENLTWELADGTLTVSGTGAMDDYPEGDAPWADRSGDVTALVLTGGVTYIGEGAFADFDNLTEIDFGDSLEEIGKSAFFSCDKLTELSLPAAFRTFAEECFRDCGKLAVIRCAGKMPHFRSNCLWNGKPITVYCPASKLWIEEYVLELEENFHGRLTVLASDGSDPFHPVKPTETAAPTAEATEAPTQTEPPAEETTVPATEVTTEPTQPVTEETAPPTSEEVQDIPETTDEPPLVKRGGGSFWIPAAIIAVILTAGILIALLTKGGRGGKYSR